MSSVGLMRILVTLCMVIYALGKGQDAVIQSNNLFGTSLYDALRREAKDNLIVSPLSISATFAMLQAGARGESAKSIRSVLHFPSDKQLNCGYRSLLKDLQNGPDAPLQMVNRMFPAVKYQLNTEFTRILKSYYNADPICVNFHDKVKAAKKINQFIANSTKDLIKEALKPEDLQANTVLALVNALHFKGLWKIPFPKESTKKADFFTSENSSVKVDMMQLESRFMFASLNELDASAISLPYKGDKYSMLIVLPKKRSGLRPVEEHLKSYKIERILEKMSNQTILLRLPRFKIESFLDLQKPLTQLGLGDLFDSRRANLSGIASNNDNGKLYVSKALQKAYLEVNEEGTEAAAATVVTVATRSGPVRLTVNKPFFGLIYGHGNDTRGGSNTILFQYRIVNPTT